MSTYTIKEQPGVPTLRTNQVPKHYLSAVYPFAPANCQLSAEIDIIQQELKIEGGMISTDFINCKIDGPVAVKCTHTFPTFYLMLEGNLPWLANNIDKRVFRQGQFYLLQPDTGEYTLQLSAGKYLLARITLYPFLLQKFSTAGAIIRRFMQESAGAGTCMPWNCVVTSDIHGLLSDILQYHSTDALSLIALHGKILQLASRMLQVFDAGGASSNNSLIHTIQCYIDNHLDKPLTLKRLAKIYPISETSIKSQFRNITGENFSDYLIRKRMETADRLLWDGDLSIGSIALQVGYEEATNFTREYKRFFQRLPSEVRKGKQRIAKTA